MPKFKGSAPNKAAVNVMFRTSPVSSSFNHFDLTEMISNSLQPFQLSPHLQQNQTILLEGFIKFISVHEEESKKKLFSIIRVYALHLLEGHYANLITNGLVRDGKHLRAELRAYTKSLHSRNNNLKILDETKTHLMRLRAESEQTITKQAHHLKLIGGLEKKCEGLQRIISVARIKIASYEDIFRRYGDDSVVQNPVLLLQKHRSVTAGLIREIGFGMY